MNAGTSYVVTVSGNGSMGMLGSTAGSWTGGVGTAYGPAYGNVDIVIGTSCGFTHLSF